MCERRENGGRKEKEDRNSEDEEEVGDSQENTMNTRVTSTENQTFISITTDFFVPYKFSFYRIKRAVTGRRCIAVVREVVKESWLTRLTHLCTLQYLLHEMTRRTVVDGDNEFKSRIPEVSLSRFLSELHPCKLSSFRSMRPWVSFGSRR